MDETIKMGKLTERQLNILRFIEKNPNAGNRDIKDYLEKQSGKISRVTVVRDIDALLANRLIVKTGQGRSIGYHEAIENESLRYIDTEEYFRKGPDDREVSFERFNQLIPRQLAAGYSYRKV